MMNFDIGKVHVPLWVILALAITVVSAGLLYWYFMINPNDSKLIGLVGGVATGLIVYLATFITILSPLRELDRYQRMGVKGLLANRHDKDYYRRLVEKSTMRIEVMGASCTRFVHDFLDLDSDDKALIDALTKRQALQVRLLIPDEAHMAPEANLRSVETAEYLARVRERFGDRVELRRFANDVRHSFVIADNDLVAGPVFDDTKSRHAPAIHVALETPFGQKYARYFETVWQGSSPVA